MKYQKLLAAVLLSLWSMAPTSAEIRMLGNPAMSEVMATLTPQFQHVTGNTVEIKSRLFPQLKPLNDANDFDIIVTTGEVADYVAQQAKIDGKLINIAQVGIGVAIKSGAPKPDISTTEAFAQGQIHQRHEWQHGWELSREINGPPGHL
jgi:molybdate transport system substrate-binding protein